MTSDDFGRSVDLLVKQVGHWTPARWRRPITPPPGSLSPAGPPADSASPPARPTAGSSASDPTGPAAPTPGAAPGESRADAVHALVRRLAALAAAAESEPVRPVPRLDNDLALVDQVRVVAADLVAAGPDPDTLRAAAADVAALRARLD